MPVCAWECDSCSVCVCVCVCVMWALVCLSVGEGTYVHAQTVLSLQHVLVCTVCVCVSACEPSVLVQLSFG